MVSLALILISASFWGLVTFLRGILPPASQGAAKTAASLMLFIAAAIMAFFAIIGVVASVGASVDPTPLGIALTALGSAAFLRMSFLVLSSGFSTLEEMGGVGE